MEQHEDDCRAGDQHTKQDYEESVARLEEHKRIMEAKMILRQCNLNPERPDCGFLRTLDSSIKRNTAVIKKLRQMNEEQREGLIEELKGVNLSKFVSEAVAAICDAKLRTSDIPAAVQICSLLHQRYKDFSPSLVQGLLKVCIPGKSGDDLEVDKSTRALKRRSSLKLLMELYFVGVTEDYSVFLNIIKDLTGLEHLRDRDATQMNLSLLTSFARQGRFLLGLPLLEPEINEEFFSGLNITTEHKKNIKKAICAFFDVSADLLLSEHSSLQHMEHENAKTLSAKGELSDENASAYEKLRKSFDHLFRGVSVLAEALDIQPPVLPKDGHTRITTGEDGSFSVTGKDSCVLEPVWDDEDTRAFYECLPDLRAFVPAVLLGETEPRAIEPSSKPSEKPTEPSLEMDHGQEAEQEPVQLSADSELHDGKANEKGKEKGDRDKEKQRGAEKGKEKDAERKGEIEKEKCKSHDGPTLDSLLQRLPGCVSRDLIDQLTVEFCYLNSKSNRKKLVRTLFNVPRTSLELLPYYSRMVATLSTCMKDVSSMLLQMLEEEFNFLITKKDQMNIETKIRNIRFIGELCKFKIAPPGVVFTCLKACLDDFTHHNIDVCCNLLETCGRFLYRSHETTIRMANMLEILMRLKNVKNLDIRHSTLVENAYYLCKPPERSARVSKVRPPLHQYVRKLLFSDLDKSSVEHVLRQLRKLPWDESELYILKCFMKVHKGRYNHVHLIASLTAGLSRYHEEFAVMVIDELLEEIRVGLELNDYGMQQRRMVHMRFLGELYNYELIESSVIFEMLYLILIFGYDTPEQDILDPPEDCFRIRMVITLLQTCGHYFDRGSTKRKLDRFLIYFQRYVLSKGSVPLDIEFDIQDLFADLRPSMVRYYSIEEANIALIELEEHEHNMASEKANGDKNAGDAEFKKDHTQGSMTVPSNWQKSMENGIEENGVAHEDLESNSESGSGSIDADGVHDDEEVLDEERSEAHDEGSECEDDEGVAPVGSEEDDVPVRQKMLDLNEEADFDRELRTLMQESLDSRRLELRGRSILNMSIPINVFESSKDASKAVEGESGDEILDDGGTGESRVRVKVLVKKGSKQQTKQMYIPSDCSLVQCTKQKEAAELEEKQNIKRLVLEYNDREEESTAAAAVQPNSWMPASGNKQLSRIMWEGVSRTGGTRQRYYSYGGSYGRRK